ncbi:MAG: DMT family transporter, partial [Dethiosulfovibrio sp.]|nr:DMT family transporter [Dethiosulfovibrio sp.]
GFMMSLRTLSVPVGMVIHYTFPLLTALGALWITKERPSLGEWLGGGMIIAGLSVAAGGTGSISTAGVMWGGISAIAMAVQSLFGRKVSSGRSMTPVVLLFYSNALGVLWLLGGRWLFMGSPISQIPMEGILWASFLGLAASCLAYGLYFEGMKYVTASSASLGVTVEIVAATSMAAAMLGEFPSVREVVGCAMVMGAVVLAAFSRKGR